MCGWTLPALTLDTLDHIGSIATALIAALAYIPYAWGKYSRRRALEDHLAEYAIKAPKAGKIGQCSVVQLMARLRITEAQVYEAAYASKKVKAFIARDGNSSLAGEILFGLRS